MKLPTLISTFIALAILSASVSSTAQTKVACIGDSITYGLTIDEREQNSYPAVLQKLLGSSYEVGNFGKSGATLLRHGHRPYTEQEEFRQVIDYKADIAVIHLGINDTDPRNWPNYRDEFVSDYLYIINALKEANPKVRIMIARMTPITHNHPRFQSGTKQWHGEINSHIELISKISGTELIDFHAPLYRHYNLIPDSVHPNAEGAKILAHTVYSGITGDYGGLQMPQTYSDNMVLQREVPLKIAGSANAGENVKVTLNGKTKHATADNRGKWNVTFEPMKAGRNMKLSVSSAERKLAYENVAVGEVWLCSGQSNMRFLLNESSDMPDDESLACKDIRLFDMRGRWNTNNVEWSASVADSVNRLQYFADASWKVSSKETAHEFSAVGYHFAKMLQDSLKVPVGIICNAVGGATTESWVGRNTLETEFPAILNDWLGNDFIQDWARGRAALNMGAIKEGTKRHPYEPCYLFETGILALDRYPIKGVIWYQGESNAHNFTTHERLFKLLADSWRTEWENPGMPIYYVQLSSLNRPSWGWFRDSQRRLLDEVENTGMAVCLDRGDSLDVHPKMKADVGHRLARLALFNDYGYDIVPSGPLFEEAYVGKGGIRVEFEWADGLSTSDGLKVRGFELAGEDEIFYPAEAEIAGDAVILRADDVKNPMHVRYAWAPYTTANLVNADGLPASTFRSAISR